MTTCVSDVRIVVERSFERVASGRMSIPTYPMLKRFAEGYDRSFIHSSDTRRVVKQKASVQFSRTRRNEVARKCMLTDHMIAPYLLPLCLIRSL
jgi:hypothetical protein